MKRCSSGLLHPQEAAPAALLLFAACLTGTAAIGVKPPAALATSLSWRSRAAAAALIERDSKSHVPGFAPGATTAPPGIADAVRPTERDSEFEVPGGDADVALGAISAPLGVIDLAGPIERDSESHVPAFRKDSTAGFVSGTDGAPLGIVDVEVPRTFSKFMEGLMWRRSLSDQQGMLFRWSREGSRAFWMENTYVGLDIVYIDHGWRIVSIKQGNPLTLKSIPSDAPASYAIEVPRGWCQRHGVAVGDRVSLSAAPGATFVATDAPHFGATPAQVEVAVRDGNYHS